MTEQIKTPENELNEMEISNLLDAEVKTLIVRILKELNEDLDSIKKIQSDVFGKTIEIKNNLQGNNSRVDEAESQINDLEHKESKNNQSEQKKKKNPPNEDSVSSLWDNFKRSNICLTGVPEGKRKSKKLEIYLKK